jgi:SAM-dependent methyltransferase
VPATFAYPGQELDLFAAATRWKSYVRRQVTPYIGRQVLEVGSGIGGTTRHLNTGTADRWVCLEPDPALAERARGSIESGELPANCEAWVGTVETAREAAFDTVLYMDVLEHIEGDRAEMERAAGRLEPGGHVVVLCPAHQWLFTPFDAAIGHFRRYTKSMFVDITPAGLELIRLSYLDSVGLFASLANKLLLRSAMPTAGQIAVWDRLMVPLSRVVDPILCHSLGKSVLGVWRRVS